MAIKPGFSPTGIGNEGERVGSLGLGRLGIKLESISCHVNISVSKIGRQGSCLFRLSLLLSVLKKVTTFKAIKGQSEERA